MLKILSEGFGGGGVTEDFDNVLAGEVVSRDDVKDNGQSYDCNENAMQKARV